MYPTSGPKSFPLRRTDLAKASLKAVINYLNLLSSEWQSQILTVHQFLFTVAKEQRKWKEVQQRQVGRILGINLLVGKQEDNSSERRNCPPPRTKNTGGSWPEEPLSWWPWVQKAAGLFLLLWKSSNPLMTNPVTSRVVQPLQGSPTMAQHSYDWGFNSY